VTNEHADTQARATHASILVAQADSELSDDARRLRVDELNAEARTIRRTDYVRLRDMAEEAFELACQTDADGEQYTFGMASALSLLAHRSCTLGDGEAALSQASQALAFLGSLRPTRVLGDAYETLGWTHYYMGDYVAALDHLTRSLRVAEAIEDRGLEAYALDRIACVHASAGHLDVALEAHRRALAIHRERGDALGEALALNNIAYTYLDLGDPEAALASAEAALRFCECREHHFLEMGVLDTLGEIHLRTGNLDAAQAYSERGLALARSHRSEPDEANSMMVLGRIAFQRGAMDEALESMERALHVAEDRSRAVEQYECHELLSQVHERRGELDRALFHYRRFHELKQAKVNEETTSRLANLRVEHQVESSRKDAEIERLRSLALEREVEERRLAQARLEAQASLDPLTGLHNRRHLAVLAEELARAAAEGRPVSLMIFDIDRFKQVNDTRGHRGGDRVLVSVARELVRNSRDTDTPCRYGGDEFLVLLTGMDARAAGKAAERLRSAVSDTPVKFGDAAIPITISAGVASVQPGGRADLASLIEAADRALYAAKQGGRDRIVMAGAGPLPGTF
jgi:diguanylate cyclase (GGDEF)-like protein